MAPVLFMTAAGLNVVAGLLHLWVIYKGPEGYRQFGAGERIAKLAERGHPYPVVLTLAIASALFFFGYLCLSQAQAAPEFPFARHILWLLTGVYLLRGLYPLLAYRWIKLFQSRFFVVSSLIVLGFGVIQLLALLQS